MTNQTDTPAPPRPVGQTGPKRWQRPAVPARVVSSGTAILLAGTVHLLALLNWSTELDRTANPLRYASNFFDAQARALMDGHLYIDDGTLGIEAFVERGHSYMYFGPFPALLRIPVLWTTAEFDGRLTLVSMLAAFVVLCVMITRLLWHVRDLVRGPDTAVSTREAGVLGVVLVLVLAGTSQTYNASLPWAYHEVYAWAVALAVGAAYWMLRVLQDPARGSIGWLVAFDLALVFTRTPGGMGVCLGTILIGLWLFSGRRGAHLRRTGLTLLLLAVGCVAAGMWLNYAKFEHLYMFPLEDQVWTDVNAHRREALRVNGGTITGLHFFATTFMAYFRLDGVRFVDYFPWVTFPAEPARGYAGAFLDQSYRTGSVTALMPLLLVMALACLPLVFRPRAPEEVRRLRIPVVALVLISGAVMNYGYIAYRYTGDFVPALILGTVITGVYVAAWWEHRPRWVFATGAGVLVMGTVWSVVAHLLLGFATAAFTSPGPVLTRYLQVQQRLSPEAQAALTTISDSPPTSPGRADELHIEGDCDALFVESGEAADRWLLAERRSLVVVATLDPDFRSTSTVVARIDSEPRRWVRLQTNSDHQARIAIEDEEGTIPGPWFDVPPPYELRIGVRDLPAWGYAEVSSTPGGFVGFVRSFSWDRNWERRPIAIEPVIEADVDLRARGLSLTAEKGPVPPMCRDLRAALEPGATRGR